MILHLITAFAGILAWGFLGLFLLSLCKPKSGR